jgi:hypothetical protein
MMAQFLNGCENQVADLKTFLAEGLSQSINLDGAQHEPLTNARRIADQAADKLARNCLRDVPAEPSARFDAMERGIDGIETALRTVQLPLQDFYESLKDDQKLRLMLPRDVNARETSGSASGSGPEIGKRRRTTRSPVLKAIHEAPPWSCEQWQAELRAWPITRIEEAIAVGPRQRATFYELAASMQRAADMLADSCPHERGVTLVSRIAELRKELVAVQQSIAIVRPALERFYGALDGGQKTRFGNAL